MTKLQTILIALLGLAAFAPSAHARSVYLNGVDISDVRDQTFKKATVIIDSKGNIRIEAPGYKVEVVEPTTADKAQRTVVDKGGPNANLNKRYYLVTQPSKKGRAQYDFSLSVNGIEKKRIQAGSSQVIMEISAWLQKGENKIVLKAQKNTDRGVSSNSPTDEARIMIGEGHEEGKVVKIDLVRLSLKVNASQSVDAEKHLVLVAK